LNDQETFAWQLGEVLGEKFQVFNYGFHGYGSHQMLALIESGRLDALVRRYKQIYAFYLTISSHPERCVGLMPWDPQPSYILENGALRHVSKASDYTLNRIANRIFVNSQLYRKILLPFRYRQMKDLALDTHVAIIAQSMHELEVRYHAHALTVIYPDFTAIEPMLRNNGVRTLSLTSVMPDFASRPPEKYHLKDDGHANAFTNMLIAGALAEYILKSN